MTAATQTVPVAAPPLQRLTLVELRKMVDTRAGFWLLLLVALSALALVVLRAERPWLPPKVSICTWLPPSSKIELTRTRPDGRSRYGSL